MNELSEKTPHRPSLSRANAEFHGVRYLVADVKRAIHFYATNLGFKLEHQQPPAFATVSLGPLNILLSGPGASGARPCRAVSGKGPAARTVSFYA